jgi:hypothetical protein
LSRNRRVVVEVREDLHREIRKHAVLNDVKIYELANAIIEDYLKDEEQVRRLIRKLRIQLPCANEAFERKAF